MVEPTKAFGVQVASGLIDKWVTEKQGECIDTMTNTNYVPLKIVKEFNQNIKKSYSTSMLKKTGDGIEIMK